jgi:penicillin-binding protein 1A
VFGAWPTDEPKAAVIWEAFKPESEPRRSIRRDEMANRPPEKVVRKVRVQRPQAQQRDSDFLQNQGGIY